MSINRKYLIVLLIFIGAFAIVGSVCASDSLLKTDQIVKKVSTSKVKQVKVKIYNFKPGVSWAYKAVKFLNGDAIAGYVEYNGNSQFDRGTGVTAWYIGTGLNGDIEPHHTKLVKAKFLFKNSIGKVKKKTVMGNGGGHIRTNLIDGYTPYKAIVYYKSY